jgi:hypothetical protein
MVGFAPTIWKTAQLTNEVALEMVTGMKALLGDLPKFVKQHFGPPQETQPRGSDDTWRCDQQRADFGKESVGTGTSLGEPGSMWNITLRRDWHTM